MMRALWRWLVGDRAARRAVERRAERQADLLHHYVVTRGLLVEDRMQMLGDVDRLARRDAARDRRGTR